MSSFYHGETKQKKECKGRTKKQRLTKEMLTTYNVHSQRKAGRHGAEDQKRGGETGKGRFLVGPKGQTDLNRLL